jgi:hypothetical protein
MSTILARHAEAIRKLSKRAIEDAIEIGRRLTECKQVLGHGHFGDWLAWCERTARRFMSLYELSTKTDKLSELGLPLSSLYLLAARSTPEIACREIIARAKAELDGAKRGEHVSVEAVKSAIMELKTALPPPERANHDNHVGRFHAQRIFRDYRRRGHPISRACWIFLSQLKLTTDIEIEAIAEALQCITSADLSHWGFGRSCSVT